jgi:hypothetical protein
MTTCELKKTLRESIAATEAALGEMRSRLASLEAEDKPTHDHAHRHHGITDRYESDVQRPVERMTAADLNAKHRHFYKESNHG